MGALDYAITSLDLLGATLKVLPFVGETLKGAVELATKICETVQQMKDNRESYEQLAVRVTRLLAAIANIVQKASPDKLKGMEGNLSHLLLLLQEIQSGLQRRLKRGPVSPTPGKLNRVKSLFRDKARDVVNVSADQDEIKSYQQKIDEAVQEFDVMSLMRIDLSVEDVRALSTSIAKRVEDMQREQTKDAMNAVLASLKPVISARWDEAHVPPCMVDTRTQLLADIAAWATSPSAPLVFWLNGLAGTGKSTVARTMCERLEEQGVLAASFFVTRQVSERRAASNIIRTLAYQLARHQRPVAVALCETLRDSPDLGAAENLPKLVTELFNKSAGAVSPGAGLILVIDALDECTEDAQGRHGGDLVPLLIRSLLQLAGRLKLLITSRAEPTIQRMFDVLSTDAHQAVLQLHDLDRSMVRSDIKTYLTRSCEAIVKTRPGLNLNDWPSPVDIETLLDLSDVLFVFASTAIRFLDSPKQSPRARLDFMLARRDGKMGSPFRFLDQLYLQVLENAVKTDEDDEDMLCDRLRSVVGGVVVVQYPLPVDAYAILLLMDRDEVQLAAESLSAFLLFKGGDSVRIFHPSFPDFITNPKRCDDVRFRVRVADNHRQLAYGCLVLLNQHLCYDIASLGDPSIANVDVAGLNGRLHAAICSRLAAHPSQKKRNSHLDRALPDALRYACRYWASHLASTVEADATLRSELSTFCERNLFHWLELLSLFGVVASADQSLRVAVAWCETHMNDVQTPSAADLLRDTLHTVHTYITPIRSHALHVYHSAFVTMPACPLLNQMLQQFGQAELPQLISQRATSGWPWATVLEGHEGWALSVAVSKDGRRIASGARDNTVRVWDAVMLEEIAVLKGHEHWVTSVVFCPDGKRLLSASDDGTIRMWDVNSYSAEPIAVLLCEDTGRMLSVAVSPDGEHIASGSADSAVRVWNADAYDSSPRILRGHNDEVNMVAYSPNNQSIVSCSDDGTVRIWDAAMGEQLGVMEHDYSVLCVAFSWDGTRLVSGSWDCTARVWDAKTYDELARLEGHEHAARAAAFSPDGQSIVSGSGNGTVRVWNSQSFGASGKVTVTSNELATLGGHEGDVNCIVFSPDGRSFISVSNDWTVRVWDTLNSGSWYRNDGPEILHQWVNAIAFSDTSRVASGHGDSVVRVFSETADFSQIASLEGHTDQVRSIVYSPDHKRIITGSDDGIILVWDAINFGQPLAKFKHDMDIGIIRALAVSPDGTRLASGAQSGQEVVVHIWDAIQFSKKPATLTSEHDLFVSTKSDSLIHSLTFAADGNTLVLRTEPGQLYAWKRHEERQDIADETWSEIPITLKDVPSRDVPTFFVKPSGWLECNMGIRKVPVLWLPYTRRPKYAEADIATCDGRVALGSTSGGITVLDFSRVLGKTFALG